MAKIKVIVEDDNEKQVSIQREYQLELNWKATLDSCVSSQVKAKPLLQFVKD